MHATNQATAGGRGVHFTGFFRSGSGSLARITPLLIRGLSISCCFSFRTPACLANNGRGSNSLATLILNDGAPQSSIAGMSFLYSISIPLTARPWH